MQYGVAGIAVTALAVGCSGTSVGEIGGETVQFDAADALRAQTDDGRIEVTVGSGDGIQVEILPGSGADDWTDRVEDGTLFLEATCGAGELGCGVGFVLTVPADQAFDVESGAGSVDLGAGLEGVGAVQTNTGLVTAEGLAGMDLSVLSGSGEQTVTFAETPAAVDLDGGSANIVLNVPAGGYALDLDTNGELTQSGVTDDPNGPVLRCQSGTGDIAVVGL